MTEFKHRKFGNQLRRWRGNIQPPMTQRTLARRIGVSDGFLAHMETGRTLPGIKTLQALSKALGVPEAEMLLAAGYLRDEGKTQDKGILDDPELRLFFRDDFKRLTSDEKVLFVDLVRMFKTRLARRSNED
ncbi:helix-turn-helix domain-containing protein [Chloroflexota bacterium]